jgi:cyclic pyranopterin phosphate synthase
MLLFKSLSRHLESGALEELTLTTNGSQLPRYADELVSHGVRRINVSVDSLDPEKFRRITRRGDLAQVLKGIAAAKKAGLKIKINTVALKGVNDDEIDKLVWWCGEQGFDLTFIETMPMGDIEGDRTDHYLSSTIIRDKIERSWTLEDIDDRTGGPARYVSVLETGRRIGFITPLSHNFCESCNRVRLTCTGMLYMCLGQMDNADLRKPLRQSESDDLLKAAIDEAIGRKPKGHDFVIGRNLEPSVARHMSVTGG